MTYDELLDEISDLARFHAVDDYGRYLLAMALADLAIIVTTVRLACGETSTFPARDLTVRIERAWRQAPSILTLDRFLDPGGLTMHQHSEVYDHRRLWCERDEHWIHNPARYGNPHTKHWNCLVIDLDSRQTYVVLYLVNPHCPYPR